MKPKNPAAFPTFERVDQWDKDDEKYRESMLPTGGMELRDYLAAKALQGMLANSGYHFDGIGDPEAHAARAFVYADAMLAERAK